MACRLVLTASVKSCTFWSLMFFFPSCIRIHYKDARNGALCSIIQKKICKSKNAAHDQLRRRRHTTPLEPLENVLEAPQADRGIADYLTALEEKYRLPLLLKFDEEMQEKEIAAVLHLPRGTVSSRIARGLEMLRKEMNREENSHA